MDINRVFVYGTLLSGMSNHDRYCGDALTIEPAVTTGRLYHLPYGFPAMFDSPDGQVFGEVMSFPDIEQTLERLDRLEGYRAGDDQSHYIRIKKAVLIQNRNFSSAWMYIYPKNRFDHDFTSIPSGCWRAFISKRTRVFTT